MTHRHHCVHPLVDIERTRMPGTVSDALYGDTPSPSDENWLLMRPNYPDADYDGLDRYHRDSQDAAILSRIPDIRDIPRIPRGTSFRNPPGFDQMSNGSDRNRRTPMPPPAPDARLKPQLASAPSPSPVSASLTDEELYMSPYSLTRCFDEYRIEPYERERIIRLFENTLNRCFDDIERFVARIQSAAIAQREIEQQVRFYRLLLSIFLFFLQNNR